MIHEFCISEVSFLNVAPVQGAVVLVLCPNCTGLSDFALPMVSLIDLRETSERVSGGCRMKKKSLLVLTILLAARNYTGAAEPSRPGADPSL